MSDARTIHFDPDQAQAIEVWRLRRQEGGQTLSFSEAVSKLVDLGFECFLEHGRDEHERAEVYRYLRRAWRRNND